MSRQLALQHAEPGLPPATFVGDACVVSCADGRDRRYVNLDWAASTPALRQVADAVDALLPWYSSVHRGSGLKSQVTTAAVEGARLAVAEFVDARGDDVVIFVRNTTDAINALGMAFGPESRILSSPAEHHANMLPWRRHRVELLPFAASPEELLADAERALERGRGRIELLAVTGASNVTGEVWPVQQLAALAHGAGAELFVDAAQLAPHRAIGMREDGIDYLALSGHKLYAPYGAGALVGRPARLAAAEPFLRGGGAVKAVTLSDVIWAGLPDRFEAGSPNAIGAVALGASCDALRELGMDRVADRERRLAARLAQGLAALDGIRPLRMWDEDACDRVGVTAFVSRSHPPSLLATILGVEHAIGVRSGRFCAHPLVARMLGADEAMGADGRPAGAVRASIGLGTSEADVDRLLAALHDVVANGAGLEYRYDARTREYAADRDPRRWPRLPFRLERGPSAEEPC